MTTPSEPIQQIKLKQWGVWLGSMLLLWAYACNLDQKEESVESIPAVVDFNFHVKPILSDRCFACHGPDENAREADLRLDTEAGAFAAIGELKDHYAIVPGDPEKSAMVHRIRHSDPEERMPPPESNLSLSETEIRILEKWIEQGAEWKNHWSFIPPEKAELPQSSSSDWIKNPIDNFVLARLQEMNLQPSPPASREALIRRVTLDLTGLPPELNDIDNFIQDQDTKAFEKVVDRLLASSDFGERMAVEWLDVARYADTNGYQDDLYRTMWPWRDWVIQAFNSNMPIDEFIKWQIAGDMFENASYQQILATAFNRNHMITQEGGVIDEEYRVEYVADRTNTTGSAFLGLTLECARCHDHKYDPISTKDYYSVFSFYNNVPEKGQVAYNGVPAPSLKIPEEEIAKIRKVLDEDITKEQDQLERRTTSIRSNMDQVVTTLNERLDMTPRRLPQNQIGYYTFDDEWSINGRNHNSEWSVRGEPGIRQGKYGQGIVASDESYIILEEPVNADSAFSIGLWINPTPKFPTGAILAKMENSDQGRGYKGFDIFMSEGKIAVHLINAWPFNAIKIQTTKSIPFLAWSHVAFSYDGSRKAEGVNLYINGVKQTVEVETDNLKGSIQNKVPLRVGRRNDQGGGLLQGVVDEVSIFKGVVNGKVLYQYDPVLNILSRPPGQWNQGDSSLVVNHYLYNFDDQYQESVRKITNLREREFMLKDPGAMEVLVMKEMDTVRQAYVLERGGYENHGEQVEPSTPSSVLPFPPDLPRNRIGLAQWLISPQNPLTARVFVNRYWQLLFGRGIVGTPGDFGSQGELPSHPQLLDWLAVDFMESGWDLKRLLKQIVMSATYQQSSAVDDKLYRKDQQNRWLARGPRHRLSAEMLRDQALAISGLLVNKIGGPPVKPYQPQGLWEEKTSGGGYTKYVQGKGEDLYRKSLYTYWKRTVPPPSMMTFDASERNLCVVKRQSTSTPLQALVLLNDPQFLEASRKLAELMLQQDGGEIQPKVEWAFRKATGRYPGEKELEVLMSIYRDELQSFEEAPARSEELLATGDAPVGADLDPIKLAALTIVANTIFNLSETITKG